MACPGPLLVCLKLMMLLEDDLSKPCPLGKSGLKVTCPARISLCPGGLLDLTFFSPAEGKLKVKSKSPLIYIITLSEVSTLQESETYGYALRKTERSQVL